MELIVQPDAGIAPTLAGIKNAKRSVDLLIFRLDRREIVDALTAAVARGVRVRALTAYTNKGGDRNLRKLEMVLLEGGVTVSRTAHDLVRYHGKMMIVDGSILHFYGFNFTRLDIAKSRSFGIVTRSRRFVKEAIRLFDADFDRLPYNPGYKRFIVSPENSRQRLSKFISGARRQLLIYDPKVSDDGMLKLITERMNAGVDVKIIGKCEAKWKVDSEKLPGKRLHIRAIVRDGEQVFLGSQSLRRLELDERREVGVIVDDERVVRQVMKIFEDDWSQTASGKEEKKESKKEAKKSEKREKKNGKEPARALAVAS